MIGIFSSEICSYSTDATPVKLSAAELPYESINTIEFGNLQNLQLEFS